MTTLSLSARLDRTDSSTSWGFRMHGGKDFGSPLTIQRVTPGSLAQQCGLQVGDAIMKIGGSPTDGMMHKEAQQQIISCGNTLELALQRGGRAGGTSHVSAPTQPAAYHSPGSQPSYQAAPAQQSYQNNASPAPYQPGGSAHVPVAVNKQYNTPINMYSVDNVMDTLATQTGSMSVGGGSDPSPPWKKGGPAGGPVGGPPAPAPVGGGGVSGGKWQPTLPTGPRTMRVGKRGEARQVSGGGARVPICNSCNVSIRGPFISALDKTWCPQHFVCANPQCRQPLIDMGFVEEAGQLFCENDYRMYFAPRCGKCGDAIIGEIVNAIQNTFHTHCFLCCHCRQPIGAGKFHTEDGNVYCPKDWGELFQTKCYGCQFPIEPGDRWVEALNQNWHSECFNCSTCQCNLEGQSFYAKGGKPYCKRHAGKF